MNETTTAGPQITDKVKLEPPAAGIQFVAGQGIGERQLVYLIVNRRSGSVVHVIAVIALRGTSAALGPFGKSSTAIDSGTNTSFRALKLSRHSRFGQAKVIVRWTIVPPLVPTAPFVLIVSG